MRNAQAIETRLSFPSPQLIESLGTQLIESLGTRLHAVLMAAQVLGRPSTLRCVNCLSTLPMESNL